MAFDNLTAELQNILLVNHSYMSKWIVFSFIIFISAFYVWGVWPNHKPTIFFTQAILRLFFFALAVGFLIGSPLMIINMTPEYGFLDWYNLILKFYQIFIVIAGVVVFIDIIVLGIFWLLAQAGLDMSNGRINDLRISWENNKHFLKMKKGGKKFG